MVGFLGVIKEAHTISEMDIKTPYFVNRTTKGHRTLHRYNIRRCPESRAYHQYYEEFETKEAAMDSNPTPQICLKCFPEQRREEIKIWRL